MVSSINVSLDHFFYRTKINIKTAMQVVFPSQIVIMRRIISDAILQSHITPSLTAIAL